MALDKQMILSELGSVMNKLQSADCGCMGKIFSNRAGQGGATMCAAQPTCGGRRQGCCHSHGCGAHSYGHSACAGEPNTMKGPCMGMQCNPPKLYADTYSYLNHNLMQPVVNEVYEDLKSINPANSVVNNPLAQMGLQQPNTGAAMLGNNMGNAQNQMPGTDRVGMQGMNVGMNQQQISGQQMNDQQMAQMMGGMGPNIVNMMNGDSKNPYTTQQGQAPSDMSRGQFKTDMNASQVQSQFVQQPTMGNAMNLNSQSIMGSNTHNTIPNTSYQMKDSNPATQQIMSPGTAQNYGAHTQGITKFNEMFPGVMQGGDLGFDPMAIAIQMNPANQQQVAMNQMQKLMSGNKLDRILDPSSTGAAMQPAITGANAAAAVINQSPTKQENIPPYQQQAMPGQQATQQNLQQDYTNFAANQLDQASQQGYGHPVPQQQQHVYSTLAPEAMSVNQNQSLQQYQQDQLNTQAMKPPNLPILYEGIPSDSYVKTNQQPSSGAPQHSSGQKMIQEQIFPVDTSKNQPPPQMRYQKQYEYNTLGQPVEMLPARMYHQAPEINLPQTLSPQPVTKFRTDLPRLDVKPTISKTSLMGSRPVGRTPSRNQLQQIYNQYKGSHSHTQQNIPTPVRGTTYSEGKLNVTAANTNQHRQILMERVAGDTLANNQIVRNAVSNKGQPMGYIGDVPADNKPHGDIVPAKDLPVKKCRNGLQDMVYTSYPTSAAWSFHGNRVPYSPVHRFRNRA